MKNVFALLALVAVAGTASAAIVATARPIDSAPSFEARGTPVFTALAGPYAAFPAATGSLGFDDFDTTLTGGSDTLTELQFVGGVTAVGGIIDFNIYDSTGTTLVSSFSTSFSQAGNFIWGITGLSIALPDQGYLELIARDGTTGQWFLSTLAPSLGSESRAPGEGTLETHSHRFELSIPAPGSLALLGMGGLVMGRRRR